MCWPSFLTSFPSGLVFRTVLCWSFLYFWEFSLVFNFLCFLLKENCRTCENTPLQLKSSHHYPSLTLSSRLWSSSYPSIKLYLAKSSQQYSFFFFPWIPQVFGLNPQWAFSTMLGCNIPLLVHVCCPVLSTWQSYIWRQGVAFYPFTW